MNLVVKFQGHILDKKSFLSIFEFVLMLRKHWANKKQADY